MSPGPRPLSVLLSIFRSLITVRKPGPFGNSTTDHSALDEPLQNLAHNGASTLSEIDGPLQSYLDAMAALDPNSLTRSEALAYWINVYNGGALLLAGEAQRNREDSILGVFGGFQRKFFTVAGENLSLDDIEHAKLRRFGDPRIHAALVCGSVSCPTLRSEPYSGENLDAQLDDQVRHFLTAGGCRPDIGKSVVHLSRVFLWFGADFVRPHRMPTLWPVRSSQTLAALKRWMDPDTASWIESVNPDVEFQRYDWGLRCTVR